MTEQNANETTPIDVGFDLGGTKLFTLVRSPAGDETRSYPSGPDFGKEDLVRIWRETIDALPEKPRHAGCAICALIRGQTVVQCNSIPGLNGLSADDLEWKGTKPVFLNDADAALLAQVARVPGERNVVLAMVGTNVGMSYMMDGRICTGCTGMAGELGNVPFPFRGKILPLGEIAGGRSLVERAGMSGPELLRAVEAGDPKVVALLDEAAEALGVALAWLIDLMNPEKLYLGGGVLLYAGFFEKTVAAAKRHAMEKLFDACRIERAEHANDIVAEGAIEQARRVGG